MSARRIAAAVLAAGGSSRLGRPKQLIPVAGVPLVRHALTEACAAAYDPVGVVLGAEATAIAEAVHGMPVALLLNPLWATDGLASSLHVAVHWARAYDADALLVSVCDQPHLRAAHLAALATAFVATERKVASGYASTRGVPAIFPRADFDALLALRGDRGAASLLRGDDVTVIAWPEGQVDLDTAEDVARFTGRPQ